MPYHVKENDGKWEVVNDDTDEVVDEHDTKEDAERQVRMLHEIEKEGDDAA